MTGASILYVANPFALENLLLMNAPLITNEVEIYSGTIPGSPTSPIKI